MGVKTGYYYKCGKCGVRLDEDEIFLLDRLNPIKFDYLIRECPRCGTKYKTNNLEFFTVTDKDCNKLLISSLITWILWIDLIVGGIGAYFFINVNQILICVLFVLFDILFGIFYFFSFKKRWSREIQKSINRFNEAEYIFNLLLLEIIDWKFVEECYKKGIVSEKIYEDVTYDINNINMIE